LKADDAKADDAKTEALKILVVEDEAAIRSGLCDVLAYHGYEPHGVERGDDGLDEGKRGSYALVILDIMLPGMNGFDVCKALRAAKPALPILILTARGAEEDVLRGFANGGDDYVSKPFSIAELVARVEALLRRSGALEPDEDPKDAPFGFGGWQIEPARRRAKCDDVLLDLTPKELDILTLFASEVGRIVSRRRLLAEVWGYANPESVETRTVDMHIAKLRKKLSQPGGDAPIETVRGEGYRFPG